MIDEGGKYTYMLSVIENKDPSGPIIYPYRQYDPKAQFPPFFHRIQIGDQFFTWWQPGLALLTIPFFMLFGSAGIYLLPAIGGGITAGFSGAIAARLCKEHRWVPLFVTLVVAFATPIAFYSQMFWEHTISSAFLMANLYLLLMPEEDERSTTIFVAGFLGAWAVFFRAESILIVAGFLIALLFYKKKKAIYYGAGFALGMILAVSLSYNLSGTFLNPNLSIVLQSQPLGVLKEKFFLGYFLYNHPSMYALPIPENQLFWGVLFFFATIIFALHPKTRWISAVSGLGVALIAVFVLFSPVGYRAVHGFLTIAPHVIFSAWYFSRRESWQASIMPALLSGSLLVFMFVYLYKSWAAAGGLQWGPRYLLPFYPMLVIVAVVALAREFQNISKYPFMRLLITGIYIFSILVGFGFSIRGFINVNRLEKYAYQTESYMTTFDDMPVLLGCDINALIPNIYWDQPVFSILQSDMAQWIDNAIQTNISQFYRLRFDLCFLNNIDEIAAYRISNPSGIEAEICSVAQYIRDSDNYCQPVPALAP